METEYISVQRITGLRYSVVIFGRFGIYNQPSASSGVESGDVMRIGVVQIMKILDLVDRYNDSGMFGGTLLPYFDE